MKQGLYVTAGLALAAMLTLAQATSQAQLLGGHAGGSADVNASTDVQPGAVGAGARSTAGAASNTTVSGGANVGGNMSGNLR